MVCFAKGIIPMSIKNKSAKTGAWLFRWRSYLPLSFIAVIQPSLHWFTYPAGLHKYDLICDMFCLAISLFGLVIRSYTIGYAPKRTSGRNTKNQVADSLNTTGMYSVTRNPLYLGNFFMMLGVILSVRQMWLPLIFALAFWIFYERIIMAEEKFLEEKFGKEYGDYSRRTPAFIPNFRLWQRPRISFSFRNVLKREYSSFFGMIVSFTILELVEDFIVQRKFVVDPVWAAIFSFGLAVYITLRTLRKKTRLLHVEGR